MQYRFTGKESRLFCHNFSRLLTFLSQEKDSQKQQQTVLALAYVGLRLRDLCSIINRFEVEDIHPEQLQTLAQEHSRANALLLPTSVNPTIWTIGHVVPAHVRQVYDKYGQGLLTVTMEGREAKHIALQKLNVNTTYQHRWAEIFRYEFIMSIWLPEQHHEPCSYTPRKNVFNDNNYCYCGLHKADTIDKGCCFCSDHLMTLIHKVKEGKIVTGLS